MEFPPKAGGPKAAGIIGYEYSHFRGITEMLLFRLEVNDGGGQGDGIIPHVAYSAITPMTEETTHMAITMAMVNDETREGPPAYRASTTLVIQHLVIDCRRYSVLFEAILALFSRGYVLFYRVSGLIGVVFDPSRRL